MKYIKFITGILIAAFSLFIVFKKIDLHVISQIIRSTNLQYLFLSLAFVGFNTLVKAFRWHTLLKYFSNFNLRNVFVSFSIGNMINMLLPFRSGDLVRVFTLAKQEKMSKASILGTIVYEHVLDLLALSVLFSTAILTYNFPISRWIKFPTFCLTLGCALFFISVFIFKGQIKKLEAWANNPKTDFTRFYYKVFRCFINYVVLNLSLFYSYKEYLKLFGYTLIIWVINGCWLYFLFLSLDPSFKYFFGIGEVSALLLALTLAVMVPSAPSYAGTIHVAAFIVLRPTEIPPEVIISYAIMIHGTGTFMALVAGFLSWLYSIKIVMPKLRVGTLKEAG